MQYRIIDSHTHIFPEKIEQKAVNAIGEFYSIRMRHAGTSEMLLQSGGAIGVEKYVVCSTATTPRQVASINDFVRGECGKHAEFLGFGTLHPAMPGEDMDAELLRMKSWGFYGVKLHPDFQEFYIDDPQALPLYQKVADAGLALLIHLGDETREFSQPRRMARVLEEVPHLRCIGAHFGGYQAWDEAYEVYRPGSLWFDISSALFRMEKAQIFRFFDKFGLENFFWGTDFPMWDHEAELERFFALGLSEEQNRAILAENFIRAFRLEED